MFGFSASSDICVDEQLEGHLFFAAKALFVVALFLCFDLGFFGSFTSVALAYPVFLIFSQFVVLGVSSCHLFSLMQKNNHRGDETQCGVVIFLKVIHGFRHLYYKPMKPSSKCYFMFFPEKMQVFLSGMVLVC